MRQCVAMFQQGHQIIYFISKEMNGLETVVNPRGASDSFFEQNNSAARCTKFFKFYPSQRYNLLFLQFLMKILTFYLIKWLSMFLKTNIISRVKIMLLL